MKTWQLTIVEFLYLLYFFVLFGAKALGLYDGQLLFNLALVAGAVLYLIKMLLTPQTVREWIITGLILAVCGLVYLYSGEKGLLLYATMCTGMKYVSAERVMRLAFMIASCGFGILAVLSFFGILKDWYHIADKNLFGVVIRRSLGYPVHNTAHSAFFVLVLLFLYLYAHHHTRFIRTGLILMGANLFLFLYTFSFTGVIATAALIVFYTYLHLKREISPVEKLLLKLYFPVLLFLSFAPFLLLKGDAFALADKVFNNRLGYPLYFFTHEKITLFGSRFAPAPSANYYLDNAFQYLFLQLGVIPFLLLCIVIEIAIWHLTDHAAKSTDDRPRSVLAFTIAYGILGLSDPLLFNTGYKNLLFLFLGCALFTAIADTDAPCIPTWQAGLKTFRLPFSPSGCFITFCKRLHAQWDQKRTRYLFTALVLFLLAFMIAWVDGGHILRHFIRDYKILLTTDAQTQPLWLHLRTAISIALFGSALFGSIELDMEESH